MSNLDDAIKWLKNATPGEVKEAYERLRAPSCEECAALRAALEVERRGRDEAMERIETFVYANKSLHAELETLRTTTYCAYCGDKFPLDDDAASAVGVHIATCPKHPMRISERERDAALARVAKLEEALRKIENGEYDNAHDPKCAAKIACAALKEG